MYKENIHPYTRIGSASAAGEGPPLPVVKALICPWFQSVGLLFCPGSSPGPLLAQPVMKPPKVVVKLQQERSSPALGSGSPGAGQVKAKSRLIMLSESRLAMLSKERLAKQSQLRLARLSGSKLTILSRIAMCPRECLPCCPREGLP